MDLATIAQLRVLIGADTTPLQKGMSDAQRRVDIFVGGVNNAARRLQGLAGAFGGVSVAAAAAFGVKFNAQMEQAQIAFTTMLKSAEKAKSFLKDMQEFAAKTPFEFTDVQNAARRFIALGFSAEQVIPTLRTVGDAVAALGGGKDMLDGVIMALGQIRTKGTVQAEELLQLAERGVPVYEILQQKLGLTAEQVRNIGKAGIDANTAINAILAGLNERFAGAMQNQSETLAGMWSNLKDNASMALGAAMQPLTDIIKEHMPKLIEQVGQLQERLKSGDLRRYMEEGIQAASSLGRGLQMVGGFLWQHRDLIVSALGAWLAFRAANLGITIFGAIAQGIERTRYAITLFQMGLRDVPGLIGKIRGAFMMLIGVNPILLAISAAVGGIIYAVMRIKEAEGTWANVWARLKIYAATAIEGIIWYLDRLYGWIPWVGKGLDDLRSKVRAYAAEEEKAIATRKLAAKEWASTQIAHMMGLKTGAEAAAAGVDGLTNAFAGGGTGKGRSLTDALSAVDNRLDLLRAKWDLWAEQNKKLEGSNEFLRARLQALKEQAAALEQAIAAVAGMKGKDADETHRLTMKHLELQQTLAKTKNEMDSLTESMKQQAAIPWRLPGTGGIVDLATKAGSAIYTALTGQKINVGATPEDVAAYQKSVMERLGPAKGAEWLKLHPKPFAEGGIVTRPTLALIGERGPEAVVPLRDRGRFGDVNVTVHITGNQIASDLDMRRLAALAADEVSRRLRQQRLAYAP